MAKTDEILWSFWEKAFSNPIDKKHKICFDKIIKQYSSALRKYHSEQHLINMLHWFEYFEDKIGDKQSFLLAIFYHDFYYNPFSKQNEIKSSNKAIQDLTFLGKSGKIQLAVSNLILSTQKHQAVVPSEEINLFLDIDLSILGASEEVYKKYFTNTRKEYIMFPRFLYAKGRTKVLSSFLLRDSIFFTQDAISKWEKQARINMQQEIEFWQ
jgi:predicted metal-dependent HD superfamily phosphohydrolase